MPVQKKHGAKKAGIQSGFPDGEYDVVLADPPWHYYGSPDKMAAAGKHYELMSKEEICALPVGNLLTKNGTLFLWATCPRLDWALDALRAWGLHFRGVGFVWVKVGKNGKPFGARGVRPSFVKPLTEMVVIGSKKEKGRPMKLASEAIVQTVFAPVGKHSEKPDEVHDRIEQLFTPEVSRIELFSRKSVKGWDSWGFEKGLFDE